MELEVIHQDLSGTKTNKIINISIVGLLKHFGLAGQDYGTTLRAIRRAIGAYFYYYDYFERASLINSRFSKPANYFYDPTDQGDFSTIAGRAIADYLARRINNATHTVTYEAAMKMNGFTDMRVSRADLYCYNSTKQFAIESKGFGVRTVSDNAMNTHKNQSGQGPLYIDFSVASVSFNLYDKIKTKYYDPINENGGYNEELNRKLSIDYYSGFAKLVSEHKNDFPKLALSESNEYFLIPIFDSYQGLYKGGRFRRRRFYKDNVIFLVLDSRIENFAREGFVNNKQVDFVAEDGLYIDNDGVGLLFDF